MWAWWSTTVTRAPGASTKASPAAPSRSRREASTIQGLGAAHGEHVAVQGQEGGHARVRPRGQDHPRRPARLLLRPEPG
eukprot:CAMPEP_0206415722 /NCGR_PEP_ID=MMETSP0294-20121207/36266_1 /ASSEMBLY_ACC=CAM_ASM_000327 /TAXON_ID=39354 /ORGANISM="Heterosigma akashiwo, Strain CCMP2393" /LENGTH=78 /DNA_ID=CAMNT_0053878131 /DNA_START=376 /DNA_END=608 /DNA_ORIENTATION=-